MTLRQSLLAVAALLCVAVATSQGKKNLFRCVHCNDKPGDDDKQPCIDKSEPCEDTRSVSCSTVMLKDMLGDTHIRKFCTIPGLDAGFNPPAANATVCKDLRHDRLKRSKVSPGPPGFKTNDLSAPRGSGDYSEQVVCICRSSNCNKGEFDTIKANSFKHKV